MTDNLGSGFCYTDHQLIKIINENPHFTNDDRFFLSFFPRPEITNSEDDKLLVSHVTKGKVVKAPFSGKCAPGKVMEYRRDARELKTYDFSHIHIKNRIEACRADDPGLRVNDDGSFNDSEQSRWLMGQQKVAMNLRESAGLTEYSMAVSALLYGMIPIEGDDFPHYTVDLCRPESHTIDLTEDGGQGVCDPCFDVFAWLEEQTKKMYAFNAMGPYDVVLSKAAAAGLAAHPQFRKWYDKCCNNYMPPTEGTLANLGPEVFATTKLFAADRAGNWRFWTHCGTMCEQVTNPVTGETTEQDVEVMPEGSMLIVDRRALASRRMFAPIRRLFRRGDNFAGIRRIASPIWLSSKVDEDCDTVDMHLWSKPLPVIGCPGATVFAKIATQECVDELCACPPLGVEPAEAVEAKVAAPVAVKASATKAADTKAADK